MSFRVTFGLGQLSWITLNPDVFVLAFCLYAGLASSEVTEAYVRNDQYQRGRKVPRSISVILSIALRFSASPEYLSGKSRI